jgi:hypothetical protein
MSFVLVSLFSGVRERLYSAVESKTSFHLG